MILTGICGVALGVGLGFLAATVMSSRTEYNMAVRDGKAVYQALRAAEDEIAKAKRLLDRAIVTAHGIKGAEPSVDYEAIEQLGALPAPFTVDDFVGLNCSKFNRETVNKLFTYAQQVDELWDKIGDVAARVPPESYHDRNEGTAADGDAFTAYRRDLAELDTLMRSTLRTQERFSPSDNLGDNLGDYPIDFI